MCILHLFSDRFSQNVENNTLLQTHFKSVYCRQTSLFPFYKSLAHTVSLQHSNIFYAQRVCLSLVWYSSAKLSVVRWNVFRLPGNSGIFAQGSNSTWCVQVLRSPEEAFAAAMQSWRERCEKCVCLQGRYVEKRLHFQLPVVSSFF